MTAFIVLLAVGLVVVGALASALRWADRDGGPSYEPLAHAEDEWSPDLPSHPYMKSPHRAS